LRNESSSSFSSSSVEEYGTTASSSFSSYSRSAQQQSTQHALPFIAAASAATKSNATPTPTPPIVVSVVVFFTPGECACNDDDDGNRERTTRENYVSVDRFGKSKLGVVLADVRGVSRAVVERRERGRFVRECEITGDWEIDRESIDRGVSGEDDEYWRWWERRREWQLLRGQ
jgi:hypothetical protein